MESDEGEIMENCLFENGWWKHVLRFTWVSNITMLTSRRLACLNVCNQKKTLLA